MQSSRGKWSRRKMAAKDSGRPVVFWWQVVQSSFMGSTMAPNSMWRSPAPWHDSQDWPACAERDHFMSTSSWLWGRGGELGGGGEREAGGGALSSRRARMGGGNPGAGASLKRATPAT